MDLGIPELTDEQIEEVSGLAENIARKLIFSKINQKLVEMLNISVEAEGAKPVSFTIEVDLTVHNEAEGVNQKSLVDDAVNAAFKAIENYLRKLT